MPNNYTDTNVNDMIFNVLDSDTYDDLVTNNQIDNNQLYLITDDDNPGVEYIVGTQPTAAATNEWTGNSKDRTLETGKIIAYKLPVAGTSTAATLNLTMGNGVATGPIAVKRKGTGNTTTHYSAGEVIFMAYDGTYWQVNADYDSNSNDTTTTYARYNHGQIAPTTKLYRYQLLLTSPTDSNKAIPINTTSNATGATKATITTESFNPFEYIYYYSTTTAIDANTNVGVSYIWYAYSLVDLRYSFNTASTLIANKDIYLVAQMQNDGSAKLRNPGATSTNASAQATGADAGPITQTLPSTDDGYIYIKLGKAYDTYRFALTFDHPIYIYKNGVIRTFSGYAEYAALAAEATHAATATTATSVPWSGVTNPPSTYTPSSHTHGNIQNNGTLQTNDVAIANGDKLIITDASNDNKVARSSTTFGTSATTFLNNKGEWATPAGTYSLPKATSSTLGGVKIGSGVSVDSNGVISVSASDLGLSNALHFIGVTTTTMSDGLANNSITVNGSSYTAQSGDVVIYNGTNNDTENVWTGAVWEMLGRDSSFKVTQTAITDSTGTSENTAATRFVYSISQNANGVISVKTRPLPTYNNYTLPAATTNALGGIKIGYTSTNKNYAVQVDGDDNAYVNVPWTDTNKYHKTGTWNGLTYTATAVNSADALAFTIPTGSTATTVALGNHQHALTIATDSTGTNQVTLAYGQQYKLTAGGTSYIFTMPASDNTWRPVGTGATDAAAGNHSHTLSLATDTGTSSVDLAYGGKYKLTAGGKTLIFTMPSANNSDSYISDAAFTDDTNNNVSSPIKLTLTRSGTSATTITTNIPKVSNSSAGVVPKGETVSTQNQDTKFLRSDGTWAKPSYTTNTNTTYTLTQDASDGHKITLTPSSGTAQTITIPDNNTWTAMTGATSSANGTVGYVNTIPPKDGYNTKYLRADGTWAIPPGTYSLPTATNTTLGGVKPWYTHTAASTGPTTGNNATAVSVNAISTTASRYYAVEADSNGRLFVNVPWTNVNSSYTGNTGTVTSVAVSNGGGLSVSGSPITTSGTITISHADTSSQSSVTAATRTYVTAVTLDTYGHVTGLSTGTETVTNTDTLVTQTATDSTNANYELLFSATADNTTRTETARKTSNLIFNPSTGLLTTKNISLTGDLTLTGDAYLNNQTYAEDITTNTLLVNGNANFVAIPTAPTATEGTNNTQLATTAFVYNAFRANDAMIFKGVVHSNSDLPATHYQGWTYKIGTAGTYAGQTCEIGDTIYCVTDGTAANNAHWVVIQNNVDGAVYRGSNAFTDANIIIADSTAGKVKSSGKTITTTAPAAAGTDSTIPTSKAVWSAITGASGYGKTGTVTSVGISNGGGLSVSGSPITASGTITISHADTSSQDSITATSRTYITGVTLDTYGHVTGLTTGTESVTNSDTKVNVTARGTTKAYLLATTTSPTSTAQAVTSVAETGVYLDTTAGKLVATTFVGALTGNADTATKLGTATLGSTTKPIYLSSGAPTECSTYAGGTAVTLNNSSKAASTASFYAPTAGGTANTQALVGNGATSAPKWVNISPSITITAGTGSATPKVNVTVLGQSGTAQSLTTASTTVYGCTILTDSISSTSTTTAATPNSVKSAYDLANTANTTANAHKYWANVEATSAAAYGKAPEMATIKLNGNTSASSASTKNVTLIYDSSLETLNFVFA